MSACHVVSIDSAPRSVNPRRSQAAGKTRKFSSNRPAMDLICDRIIGRIEQGCEYRHVLIEFGLRVEALWQTIAWGIQRMREENRELRRRIYELERRRAA